MATFRNKTVIGTKVVWLVVSHGRISHLKCSTKIKDMLFHKLYGSSSRGACDVKLIWHQYLGTVKLRLCMYGNGIGMRCAVGGKQSK